MIKQVEECLCIDTTSRIYSKFLLELSLPAASSQLNCSCFPNEYLLGAKVKRVSFLYFTRKEARRSVKSIYHLASVCCEFVLPVRVTGEKLAKTPDNIYILKN